MSGGGKSSLISLIPRFYDVTAGKILLDGTDIRSFKVRSLRDKIGMVLQDNILFSESVKENILLATQLRQMKKCMKLLKQLMLMNLL